MQRKREKQNCQNADDTQTEELLDMASAIDPRFKLKYVNKDRVEAVKISLKTEMASVFTVMKPQSSVSVTVREEAEDQNAPALKKIKKKKKNTGQLL